MKPPGRERAAGIVPVEGNLSRPARRASAYRLYAQDIITYGGRACPKRDPPSAFASALSEVYGTSLQAQLFLLTYLFPLLLHPLRVQRYGRLALVSLALSQV